jgi:hypothetical protein
MKIGKHEDSMPTLSRKMRGATAGQNEWQGTLRRIDVLVDGGNDGDRR